MGLDRIAALRAERSEVVNLCRDLSPEEWATPSRCSGWYVQDVVAHMGAAFHGTFGPWVVKLMRSNALERGNDADAEKRRDWEPGRVFGEYEKWSRRFLAVQPVLQHKPGGSIPIRLGELGTYPARLLASALTFDHYVHLRFDMATALGRSIPEADANRMAVLLEWMMAGIPAMTGSALEWLDGSVEIALRGDGAGSWTVDPQNERSGRLSVRSGATTQAVARVSAAADGFPLWATKRRPWRESDIAIDGDAEVAARFLDNLTVV
jgi:uncharacterized protein (TIGR03083 family)